MCTSLLVVHELRLRSNAIKFDEAQELTYEAQTGRALRVPVTLVKWCHFKVPSNLVECAHPFRRIFGFVFRFRCAAPRNADAVNRRIEHTRKIVLKSREEFRFHEADSLTRLGTRLSYSGGGGSVIKILQDFEVVCVRESKKEFSRLSTVISSSEIVLSVLISSMLEWQSTFDNALNDRWSGGSIRYGNAQYVLYVKHVKHVTRHLSSYSRWKLSITSVSRQIISERTSL